MFAKDFASQVVKKNSRNKISTTAFGVDWAAWQQCQTGTRFGVFLII